MCMRYGSHVIVNVHTTHFFFHSYGYHHIPYIYTPNIYVKVTLKENSFTTNEMNF